MAKQQKPVNPNQPLPANVEAEEAVLGALLIDPDAILKVGPALDPADFHVARNSAIYAAMLSLAKHGEPIDLVTLSDELERAGQLREIGGAEFLTGLVSMTPTSAHATHYAGVVRKCRVQRELIAACSVIVKEAYSANGNLPEVLASAKSSIVGVERLMTGGNPGMDLRRSCDAYFDLLDQRVRDRDKPRLEFPWSDLGKFIPQLAPGELVGLAGDSGGGKTAFLECCAEHWARQGWRVAFFHYELSTQTMLDRRIQRATGVPIKALRSGRLDSEYPVIVQALSEMSGWKGDIQYVHCPGWPMSRLLATAQRLHDAGPLDVVIVDYLQKIPPTSRGGDMNTAQMIGADVEDFKTWLESNGVVGMLAAQFDKAHKHTRARAFSDIRNTGEVEDKINVGIIINLDGDESTFNVVKVNAGCTGEVGMYFMGAQLQFYGEAKSEER